MQTIHPHWLWLSWLFLISKWSKQTTLPLFYQEDISTFLNFLSAFSHFYLSWWSTVLLWHVLNLTSVEKYGGITCAYKIYGFSIAQKQINEQVNLTTGNDDGSQLCQEVSKQCLGLSLFLKSQVWGTQNEHAILVWIYLSATHAAKCWDTEIVVE